MNPSYFRIRLPLPEAQQRLADWLGMPELCELVATDAMDAIRLACTPSGTWRGPALFMYQMEDWTIFNDLSGRFGSIRASNWAKFAKENSFVFIGYNDAMLYGELIVIADSNIQREFSDDHDNPDMNIDSGQLPEEASHPIKSWTDIASIVDDDHFASSETGWLWVGESVK